MALFHKTFNSVIVALSPMMINPNFALVHMTFNLLGSSTNPISLVTLHLTVENTIISLSRPWNESIVAQVTDEGSALLSIEICFEYGESAAMLRGFWSSDAAGAWSMEMMRAASSTWPSLPLDADPVVSSQAHCTKTVGTRRPASVRGHGNASRASAARTGWLSWM
jgi:hypothetical protein